MDISIILNQLITLFIVIGLGYFLRKKDILDADLSKKLSSLVVNLTMPALIINAVLSMGERPSLNNIVLGFIVSIGFYIIFPILGFIIAKILFIKPSQLGMYIYMTTFLNTGFMGFPLIQSLLGNNAMFYAAIVNIFFDLGCYSYGIFLINYKQNNDISFSPKTIFTPGLISCLVALLLFVINPKLPSPITAAITYVGNLTTPLAMMIIGSSLAAISLKEIFGDWKVYVFTFIKQIIVPLALFPLLKLILADDMLLKVMFIMSCLPIANTSVLFATRYKVDTVLPSRAVFISTFLSVITIPLVVYFCF